MLAEPGNLCGPGQKVRVCRQQVRQTRERVALGSLDFGAERPVFGLFAGWVPPRAGQAVRVRYGCVAVRLRANGCGDGCGEVVEPVGQTGNELSRLPFPVRSPVGSTASALTLNLCW